MRRLLMVMVAVLSLASFTTVALAQDSTATAPSGTMEKKPAKAHHKKARHKRAARKHTAAKKDTTSTH